VSPLVPTRSHKKRRLFGLTLGSSALAALLGMAAVNRDPGLTGEGKDADDSASVTASAGSLTPGSTLPVEPRLFSVDSPWNQLIRVGSSYGGVDEDGNGVLDDFDSVITGAKATRGGAMTSRQFGLPLAIVDPTQPLQKVVADCVVPGHIESVTDFTFRFAIPPSYVNDGTYGPPKTFGSGPDSALVVIDAERRKAYDFFQLNPEPDANGSLVQEGLGTLCEKGGYTTYSLDGPGFGWNAPTDKRADPKGNLRLGIRAAGSAMAGGIITRSEVSRVLAGDDNAVPHALAICLHANQLQRGWVFPAVSEDGYADNYAGTLPMGTRLAIDPTKIRPDEVDTPMGKALWTTLTQYGGYVVDQCGNGPTLGISVDAVVVEPDVNAGVAMYEDGDLLQIAAALSVAEPPSTFAIPTSADTAAGSQQSQP
jgi:hypothetical protein